MSRSVSGLAIVFFHKKKEPPSENARWLPPKVELPLEIPLFNNSDRCLPVGKSRPEEFP